jgi:hypothetical protein
MERQLSRVARMVSAGAVVLSLMFVGFEIRQNTAAQRAETRQGLAEASRQHIHMIASEPSLTEAYLQIFPTRGGERYYRELTATDTARANLLMFGNLRNLENVYLQFREGVVDESVLNTYSFANLRYQTTSFREFWRRWSTMLDPRFVEAFEEANGFR